MPTLEISLLGSIQLHWADQEMIQLRMAKAQALLAYLTVEASQPHSREKLAGLFWPEQTEESARLNLRQIVFRLRQLLLPAYLNLSQKTIQFNPDSDYRVDVTNFTQLVASCKSHAHTNLMTCQVCLAALEQAVGLYRGDFLADFSLADSPAFEEWALLKREWLRREALQALYQLAAWREQQRNYEQAYQYAWRQVELDSLREEAHQQLMRVLALSGRRTEALAQYESCRRLLAEELAAAPAAETVALYERIRTGELSRGAEELQEGPKGGSRGE